MTKRCANKVTDVVGLRALAASRRTAFLRAPQDGRSRLGLRIHSSGLKTISRVRDALRA